jgi:hypothetical protein
MITKSGRRQGAVCSRWLRCAWLCLLQFTARREGKRPTRPVCKRIQTGWAMQHACQHSPRAVTGQSEVSLVSGETLRDRVRAAYLLQAGRDLRVIQMGVVATLAADELKLACVSAIHPPICNQGRLASQHRSAAVTRLTGLRGGAEPGIAGMQPRITGVMWAARCVDRIRTAGWRRAVRGAEPCALHRPPRPVVEIPAGVWGGAFASCGWSVGQSCRAWTGRPSGGGRCRSANAGSCPG